LQISIEHSAFLESGVSIIVASRDSQNRPLLGRCAGCLVAPDRSRVTIFLSRRKYPLVLDAIRRSGALAVSFSEPSSNRSLQLKAKSARLVEVESCDAGRIAAYLDLFAADIERVGHRGVLARTVVDTAPADLTAIAFTPYAAFSQTPGPVAGNRIDT